MPHVRPYYLRPLIPLMPDPLRPSHAVVRACLWWSFPDRSRLGPCLTFQAYAHSHPIFSIYWNTCENHKFQLVLVQKFLFNFPGISNDYFLLISSILWNRSENHRFRLVLVLKFLFDLPGEYIVTSIIQCFHFPKIYVKITDFGCC